MAVIPASAFAMSLYTHSLLHLCLVSDSMQKWLGRSVEESGVLAPELSVGHRAHFPRVKTIFYGLGSTLKTLLRLLQLTYMIVWWWCENSDDVKWLKGGVVEWHSWNIGLFLYQFFTEDRIFGARSFRRTPDLFFHLHLDMKLGQLYHILLHIHETALRPSIIMASTDAWQP